VDNIQLKPFDVVRMHLHERQHSIVYGSSVPSGLVIKRVLTVTLLMGVAWSMLATLISSIK